MKHKSRDHQLNSLPSVQGQAFNMRLESMKKEITATKTSSAKRMPSGSRNSVIVEFGRILTRKKTGMTPDEQEMFDFLQGNDLGHIYDLLKANAFDELDILLEVTKEYLLGMEISPVDQEKLMAAVESYKNTSFSDRTSICTPYSDHQKADISVIVADEQKRPLSGLSSTLDTRAYIKPADHTKNNLIATSTSAQVQVEQADLGVKVSCWNCYRLVAQSLCISDCNKHFCSNTCFKKSEGQYKSCCATCQAVKLKSECLLFDCSYYCSKTCKPTIEAVASELSKCIKDANMPGEEATEAILTTHAKHKHHDASHTVTYGHAVDDHGQASVDMDKSGGLTDGGSMADVRERRPSSILKNTKETGAAGSVSSRGRSISKKVSFIEEIVKIEGQKEILDVENGSNSSKLSSNSNTDSLSKLQKYQKSRKENNVHNKSIEDYVNQAQNSGKGQATKITKDLEIEKRQNTRGEVQPLDSIPPAPKIKQMALAFFKKSKDKSGSIGSREAAKRSNSRNSSQTANGQRKEIKGKLLDPIQGMRLETRPPLQVPKYQQVATHSSISNRSHASLQVTGMTQPDSIRPPRGIKTFNQRPSHSTLPPVESPQLSSLQADVQPSESRKKPVASRPQSSTIRPLAYDQIKTDTQKWSFPAEMTAWQVDKEADEALYDSIGDFGQTSNGE